MNFRSVKYGPLIFLEFLKIKLYKYVKITRNADHTKDQIIIFFYSAECNEENYYIVRYYNIIYILVK